MSFYQGKPDIIIRSGTVVDGTGSLPYYADIAVTGDRIDYIGNLNGVTAPLEIDASRKYVTPGFIDSHAHSDAGLFRFPECQNSLRQGITTQIVGNCGNLYMNLPAPPDGVYAKGTLSSLLDRAEDLKPSMNTAWFCGHNTLRRMAGLFTQDYTEEQFRIMADFLREAMEAGFIGLSSGLEFYPGMLSRPDEVERLAQIAAEYDGNYATHMRDEGYYVLEAVNEFLNVIRKTGLRGTVSHLNIKYDNGVPDDYLDRAMQLLKNARTVEHLNVYCDMLSYCVAPGRAMAMMPPWLYADGWDRAKEILADPAGREKVKNDMDRYWRYLTHGGWDRLLYLKCPYLPGVSQTPFAELVKQAGKDPADVFLDVLMGASSLAQANTVGMRGIAFREQTLIDSVVKDPIYLWMTDASIMDDDPKNRGDFFHFMSMTQFFVRYVRELGVISIQDAVKKVGGIPAQHYRLRDRGVLEAGKFADINVFDLYDLKINATLTDPIRYSEGMDYVLVNGVPVIAHGEYTGARSGRVLRHLP